MNKTITKSAIGLVLSLVLFIQETNSQASISGHVFADNNRNGVFDPREGLVQVTVWLMDDSATSPYYQVYPVQTAITSTDGSYYFSNIANGNYQLKVKMSSLYNPLNYDPKNIITQNVIDNNPYNPDHSPDGISDLAIISPGNYNNIDFGFSTSLTEPTVNPARRFAFDNSTNSFVNVMSKTFDLPQENCGGFIYDPTLTISTDRQCSVATQAYPVAGCNSCANSLDWPGPNKGGFHSDDVTLQMNFGQACYTAINNDRASLTLAFNAQMSDVRFSIYDIDAQNPQLVDGSIDHVKVTGYNGSNLIMPSIITPQAYPFNRVFQNTITGWPDYPDNNMINNYPDSYNSGDADHGNAEIYFTDIIDRVVIEYEEYAPSLVVSAKKIQQAVTPINDESQWGIPFSPGVRGISIGSIGYTYYCTVLAADILSFDAKPSGQKVNLEWNKGNEQDLKQYKVQRLSTTGNWITLGTIAAVGGGHQYHFTDLNPIKGINQYRLSLISNNGAYHLSEVRKVSIVATTDIEIINNPGSILTMVLYGQAKDITVFDAAGKCIFDHPITNISNGAATITLDHFAMHTGFYFVKALFADGEVKTLKFVKNQ